MEIPNQPIIHTTTTYEGNKRVVRSGCGCFLAGLLLLALFFGQFVYGILRAFLHGWDLSYAYPPLVRVLLWVAAGGISYLVTPKFRSNLIITIVVVLITIFVMVAIVLGLEILGF